MTGFVTYDSHKVSRGRLAPQLGAPEGVGVQMAERRDAA